MCVCTCVRVYVVFLQNWNRILSPALYSSILMAGQESPLTPVTRYSLPEGMGKYSSTQLGCRLILPFPGKLGIWAPQHTWKWDPDCNSQKIQGTEEQVK